MTDPVQQKYANGALAAPEVAMALTHVVMMRGLLEQHRPTLVALLEAERRMDAAGIVIDPTLYRDMLASENFRRNLQVAQATVDFLAALDAALGPLAEAKCRVCGCTEDHACVTPDGPCHWVEPDLCSSPSCLAAASAARNAPCAQESATGQP